MNMALTPKELVRRLISCDPDGEIEIVWADYETFWLTVDGCEIATFKEKR